MGRKHGAAEAARGIKYNFLRNWTFYNTSYDVNLDA